MRQNVNFFPDFLFVTFAASTPWAYRSIALTVRQNLLHKPRGMKEGRERAASGPRQRVALRKRGFRPKFSMLSIFGPCRFCAREPTLRYANSTLNKFSQTPRPNQNHKHISKNKLTSGYRKRPLESRTVKQNVEFFPDFLFVICAASTPRA